MKKIGLMTLALLLFFSACSKTEVVQSISEEELFSLNYGAFEEQLDLFSLNQIGDISTGLCMRDGFFYLVNGESNKIMEMNSYGDLLSLFYNEDSRTKELIDAQDDVKMSVHTEILFPFDFPGLIAADSDKVLYVVCTVPRNLQETDDDEGLLYKQVVLRLPRDGSSMDYIGQQGPGGTPFPLIKNLYITEKNELVVSSVADGGLIVYWFGSNGFLKYKVPVYAKDAPKLDGTDNNSELYITIENAVPDPQSYVLYVNIDYSSAFVDKDTNVQSGISYSGTMLYPLNMETELYGQGVSIPSYEETITVDYSKLTYKIPYDFLGITRDGWKFYVVSTTTGFDVEMIHDENQRILRRHFDANHSNLLYNSMNLSSEGIISALYIEQDRARVVWYRTDKLINN